ncbi:PRTRC system ParB family protein [Marinobacter halodurans]|uniref:PRTRC system ParB family protein n=1 Tax=Marinobacter halodurans TaxID=2528979 RepID=A0ABY1ZQ13_9GAMM|nr:PRTRC system ParB family protein [Marinobacter halodurans]TBW57477.1 PRTRC system ParB family protein [Marinobacter halodurans]
MMNSVATVEQTTEDGARELPTNRIIVDPERNPRRFRSAEVYKARRESIRQQGVLQSVLVRPHPEREGYFLLVAGYTRMEIVLELAIPSVPARIKNLTEREARDAALSENIHRDDMSPMDEGIEAKELLAENNNDRDEVCKRLGWSMSKLRNRIQLTHCCDEVGQALTDNRITINHAEILSTLREDTQRKALEITLKNNLHHDALREKIEALSLKLNIAPFDKTDCQNCPHNSSLQSNLFDTGINEGRCLNKQCFEQKTDEFLEETRDTQRESFNRVELDRDIAEGATTIIATSGQNGVGRDQFSACQSCSHYGALVKTRPGQAGNVQPHVCFDLKCHKVKVSSYQELIATDSGASTSLPGNAGGSTSAKVKGSKGKTTKPKAEASAPATPQKIRERIHSVHRHAAAETVRTRPTQAKAIALAELMVQSKQVPEGFDPSVAKELSFYDSDTKTRTMIVKSLAGASDTLIDDMIASVASKTVAESTRQMSGLGSRENDPYGALAAELARTNGADLTSHFTMDREYLDAHTKPVIKTLLQASGFDHYYDTANGQSSFAKLLKEKKSDILDIVEKSDFSFSGFVPDNMALADHSTDTDKQ